MEIKKRNTLLICVAALAAVLAASAFAETVKVIKDEDVIRVECKAMANIKARVKYGDPLEVISKEGDWVKVRRQNITGCIHKSAVTEKEVSLKGLSGDQAAGKGRGYAAASAEEVALAGKGFDPQVEKAFKEKHPELNFDTVNNIEALNISEGNLHKFIKNGGLILP
jgi:uncharacterized protein YgiM (DUF1202 family)